MTTNNANPPYAVIIRDAKTNEILFRDTDFSSDARYDWFEQNCISALPTEVVQLVSLPDNLVIIEEGGRSEKFLLDLEKVFNEERESE